MADMTGYGPEIPPTTTEAYEREADYEWERSIEIRLSRHGQALIGIGAGLLVVAALNMLQGKIVINLAKGQKMIVEVLGGLNTSTPTRSVVSDSTPASTSSVKYAEPSGRVDTPQPNEAELEELRNLMRESGGDSASPFEGF